MIFNNYCYNISELYLTVNLNFMLYLILIEILNCFRTYPDKDKDVLVIECKCILQVLYNGQKTMVCPGWFSSSNV